MTEPYISIFKPDETDFSGNGIRILYPSECTISETLNGEYSLSLKHPLDKYGTWKEIKEYRIVKAQGQLFRIFRKTRTMSKDGTYQISAEALHIFYDLNFYFIKETNPVLALADEALDWIVTPYHNGSENILNGDPRRRFSFYTNLNSGRFNPNNYRSAYYEKMSVTRALIGDENCFVNTWGGELLRNNFEVDVVENVGGINSFNIKYSVDMTEIQENTDLTNYASSLYYEALVYNETENGNGTDRNETVISGIVSNDDKPALPVRPMAFYGFEVNLKSIKRQKGEALPSLKDIREECRKRAERYLNTECQPQIGFTVKFADLRKFELYKDFKNLQKCGIGDAGTIYHEILGINTQQRVTKRTVDAMTGEVLSVELGSLKKTLTGQLSGYNSF